jgi:phosphohistidine phosphatase
MKTLLLMRHAKSSWKNAALPDHDRPLAKRGLHDAQRMGELIERKELFPQQVLTSSAVRAAETARIFCEICGCTGSLQTIDALYLAEADTYLEVLKTLPDDLERVLLIGHNPGLESLLQMLCGRVEALTTAVVAFLSLPIARWSELTSSTEGELIEIWRPKDLPEEKKDKKEKKPVKAEKKAEKIEPPKAKEKTPRKTKVKPAKPAAEEKKPPKKGKK